MEHRHIFPEIMLQISIAAIFSMLYNIPDQTSEGLPIMLYGLLFGYSLISYLCNFLFLRQERSIGSVSLLNGLMICAGFATALALHLVQGLPSGIFIGVSALVLSLTAFRGISGNMQMNILTLCFDILVVLLLVYTVFTELGSGKIYAGIPGILGVIASFTGIIIFRSGNRMSGKDRLFISILIFLVLAAAFLVCTLVNVPLREGLAGLFTGVLSAFRFLGDLIRKFLLFLQGLFSSQESYEALAPAVSDGAGLSAMAGEEEKVFSVLPVLILIGVLLLAAIVIAVIVFRKSRFTGKKKTAEVRKNVIRDEHVSLWKALQIWFRKVCRYLKVRIYFLKNSKTPAGRFYRILRSCRHSSLALQTGETAQEFLIRYIDSLKPEDHRIPELKRLVEELNLQLYG